MTARCWTLAERFAGNPKPSNLVLKEEVLPALSEDEILIQGMFFSVDPYMRPFSAQLPLGATMIGEQVARVLESRHKDFRKGDLVLAKAGWRDLTVLNPAKVEVIPAWDTGNLPTSYALGLFGMPGISALVGLVTICDPKPGETIFVNSSAGIVGSIVGQIGKIKGCKVIGCAGTDEKVKFVKECGFDEVFNYKTSSLHTSLKKLAPNGIDCYFDNVGGEFSSEVIMNHMNLNGRISCCGNLSGYNSEQPQIGPLFSFAMVAKQLMMKGFIIYSHADKFKQSSAQLLKWSQEGKLKVREEVVNGFENLPNAFIGLLAGNYVGKVVVKA